MIGQLFSTYHSSVPYYRHPLFNPIGSFWNQSEVVFPDSFLRCGEASLSAGGHLEISTGKKAHESLIYLQSMRMIKMEREAT